MENFDAKKEFSEVLKSKLHLKNKQDLQIHEDELYDNLKKLDKKFEEANPFDYREKYNPKLVDKALYDYEIPYKQMSNDIDKISQDKINQLRKYWKAAKKKDKGNIHWWHFALVITLIFIALVLLLVFIFI
ncbi:hypothetical protein SCLARK_00466 [Spiroplasma clarkii]|nr:hypothetical protein [Spiroplasma clarkii]ARU91180.1 hypothetical protein SCLARK_00466 [Spiroplasma clarkii]